MLQNTVGRTKLMTRKQNKNTVMMEPVGENLTSKL